MVYFRRWYYEKNDWIVSDEIEDEEQGELNSFEDKRNPDMKDWLCDQETAKIAISFMKNLPEIYVCVHEIIFKFTHSYQRTMKV